MTEYQLSYVCRTLALWAVKLSPAFMPEAGPHHFYNSANIHSRTMTGEAGKIMEEVVWHLTVILGANVQVTLEILQAMFLTKRSE